ncbi:MAG: hypothetical protein JJT95_08350 [Pararhodobacter sp.]|nr:hypothetical protein [Pararhodobacter sp.]
MKAQSFALVCAAGLALTACGDMMDRPADVDPVTRAVSGNTLTYGNVALNVNPDGTLDGTTPAGDLRGTWMVQNGQWCDTIIEPEDQAGTTCMNVELGDSELTFINPDGSRGNTWQIQ